MAEASAFTQRWTQLSARLTPAAGLMQACRRRAPYRLFPRQNGRENLRAAGLGHGCRDGRARVGSDLDKALPVARDDQCDACHPHVTVPCLIERQQGHIGLGNLGNFVPTRRHRSCRAGHLRRSQLPIPSRLPQQQYGRGFAMGAHAGGIDTGHCLAALVISSLHLGAFSTPSVSRSGAAKRNARRKGGQQMVSRIR